MITHRIRATVFDLDGTLVDSMSLVLGNYAETIRSLGGPQVDIADIQAKLHVGPTPVLLREFLNRPISDDDLAHYYCGYEAAVAGLNPIPGILEMLVALREDGYRLGVFTGSGRRASNILLSGTGLMQCFDAVVAGDEVTRQKPAPEGLLLACQILGVQGHESAYIGDSDADIECAKGAGAFPVRATWATDQSASDNACRVMDPMDVVSMLRELRRIDDGAGSCNEG